MRYTVAFFCLTTTAVALSLLNVLVQGRGGGQQLLRCTRRLAKVPICQLETP